MDTLSQSAVIVRKIIFLCMTLTYTYAFMSTPYVLAQVTDEVDYGGDIFLEDLSDEEMAEFLELWQEDQGVGPTSVATEGVVSCFDYYRFNSVEVQMTPTVATVLPGSPLTFTGYVYNDNQYPVVHGTVYAKIFHLSDDPEKNVNGPDVVDQFVVTRNIAVDAFMQRELDFTWNVPAYAEGGSYHAGFFFMSNDAYNLLGLSFTDDIVGTIAPFEVLATETGGVRFEKNEVTIQDQPYYFAAFPPRFPPRETLTVAAPVVNTTQTTQTVRVVLNVYEWDTVRESNNVRSEIKSVTVPANGTVPVSFTLHDTTFPVYIAQLTLFYEDTKSILNVRFVRDGISRLRINFPSISLYPLTPHGPIEVFACMHNIADDVVDGALRLRVLDANGAVIHIHEWSGAISGDMLGVASTFVPRSTYTTFTVHAELFQGDELIEEAIMRYACDDFGACTLSTPPNYYQWFLWFASGVSIVIVLIMLALIVRAKHAASVTGNNIS